MKLIGEFYLVINIWITVSTQHPWTAPTVSLLPFSNLAATFSDQISYCALDTALFWDIMKKEKENWNTIG